MKAEEKTVVRAVTFPFTPYEPMDWKEIDPLLRRAWESSTTLANWASQTCAKHDSFRTPGMLLKDFPKYKALDLYAMAFGRKKESIGRQKYSCHVCKKRWHPSQLLDGNAAPHHDSRKGPCEGSGVIAIAETRRRLPAIEAQFDGYEGCRAAAAGLLKRVQDKYAEERFEIVWRRERRTPEFAYPYPFPVKEWKAYYGKDNVPLVSLPLPGGRVVLRLRGGPEMRRQLAMFRQIVEGAKKCEAAVYKKGDHSMIKLVAHFPVVADKGAFRSMLVHTDPNAFWVAEMDGTHDRVWNQDHIKVMVENHRVWLQRIGEDMKREKRVPARMRRHMDQKIEDRCRKQNDRLNSFTDEMTAQLVQLAQRQKVAHMSYDDANKSWLPRFPWSQLKTKLKSKCEDVGIVFISANDEEATDDATT